MQTLHALFESLGQVGCEIVAASPAVDLERVLTKFSDAVEVIAHQALRACCRLCVWLGKARKEARQNTATSQWWLDAVLAEGVTFDILAQSCYASAPNGVAGYQGTPAQWRTTFAALAARYPKLKFMIAEYSAEQRATNDVMFELPGQRGLGSFNWDPTRAYDTHPNDPLFSTSGAWNHYVAIPEKLALYDQMAAAYGLR